MQQLTAHKRDRGFTLIEMVVTVIVVGILGAIAVPSLLGLLNQTRVNDGRRQVESALKEAQRQAIRGSRSCRVTFNATNNTITGTPVQCLAGSKIVDDDLEFKGDVAGGSATNFTIDFSSKGNTSDARTIAVYRSGVNGGIQKCVIVTSPLGGTKSGIYTGDVTSNIVQASCDVSNS